MSVEMDKQAKARAYLGIRSDVPGAIRQDVVDAITGDDFGDLPSSITNTSGWEAASDHDRKEIARYVAFLRVEGNPPMVYEKEDAGAVESGH